MPGRREQMVIDFEAGLFFRAAIKTTEIGEKIERELGRGLKIFANGGDVFARHDDRGFAQRLDDLAYPFRMITL